MNRSQATRLCYAKISSHVHKKRPKTRLLLCGSHTGYFISKTHIRSLRAEATRLCYAKISSHVHKKRPKTRLLLCGSHTGYFISKTHIRSLRAEATRLCYAKISSHVHKKRPKNGSFFMERKTRFELATTCLEGRDSTIELLPQQPLSYDKNKKNARVFISPKELIINRYFCHEKVAPKKGENFFKKRYYNNVSSLYPGTFSGLRQEFFL